MQSISNKTCQPLTPKQEAFCRAYLTCGNATQAYKDAYEPKKPGRWICNEAYRLSREERVQARLRALRLEAAEIALYSADLAMHEAKVAYDLALANLQPAAMVAATRLRAKLAGLLPGKPQAKQNSPREMSDEQLEKEITALVGELGFVLVRKHQKAETKAWSGRNGKCKP